MDSVISWTTVSLAAGQTVWLTCVSLLVTALMSPVMLSGLKIHVLTKAGSVLPVKFNLARSFWQNGEFTTKGYLDFLTICVF